ncbi:MAG: dihydroorotate dehydrogenase electron transfer subunit [Eubacteriaceae bacterium]
MAVIHRNDEIADGIYLLEAELEDEDQGVPVPGQFYMVRGWGAYPLLSRPISVFDYQEVPCVGLDGETEGAPVTRILSFLYQVVGEGTAIFTELAEGSGLELEGPFGNGFPEVDHDLTLVGGGIGIAPLYYLARSYRHNHRERRLSVYLGFAEEAYAVALFEEVADKVSVDVGGFITDQIDPDNYTEKDTVITCGPAPMMKAVMKKMPAQTSVYASLEARMACGVGACLGCVKEAEMRYKNGPAGLEADGTIHVKVCKEGPVFKREVVS